MHAIISDKSRPQTIQEGEALSTGKDAKKELSQGSADEIIKTEESKSPKSIADIVIPSKFIGMMSRTRLSVEEGVGEGSQK